MTLSHSTDHPIECLIWIYMHRCVVYWFMMHDIMIFIAVKLNLHKKKQHKTIGIDLE